MVKSENSVDPKSQRCVVLTKHAELTEKMRETLEDYALSLPKMKLDVA